MRAHRIGLVLLAAVALSACGQSKEEKRLKELKRICESAIGGTVRDLEIAYGGLDIIIAVNGNDGSLTCGTGVSTLQCTDGASRCVLGFLFDRSSDPDTCTQTGCYFTCDVRAGLEDLKAHGEDHLATICGARWVDGQPIPPFYGDPPLFVVQDQLP